MPKWRQKEPKVKKNPNILGQDGGTWYDVDANDYLDKKPSLQTPKVEPEKQALLQPIADLENMINKR